jgi:hypothetical protein
VHEFTLYVEIVLLEFNTYAKEGFDEGTHEATGFGGDAGVFPPQPPVNRSNESTAVNE